MSFIKYDREGLIEILKILLELYTHRPISTEFNAHDQTTVILTKKAHDIQELIEECRSERFSEKELNQKLWRITGAGTELYILVVVPLENIPLLINQYKGTILDEYVKIRLKIGR
jgi:hypothetical protein